jgi:hypothetical protein
MRRRILGEIDVVQHPTEVSPPDKFRWRIEPCLGRHRLEKSRKLTTSEAGLLYALAAGNPSPGHIGVLAGILGRPGLRRELEMSFDYVGDITQQETGALLTLLVDEQGEVAVAALRRLSRRAIGKLLPDLVAPNGVEPD